VHLRHTEVDLEAHRYSLDRFWHCRTGSGWVQLHATREGAGYRAPSSDHRNAEDDSYRADCRRCRDRRGHRARLRRLKEPRVGSSSYPIRTTSDSYVVSGFSRTVVLIVVGPASWPEQERGSRTVRLALWLPSDPGWKSEYSDY